MDSRVQWAGMRFGGSGPMRKRICRHWYYTAMKMIALSNSDGVAWVSDEDTDLDCFSWYLKKSDHKWYVATSIRQGKKVKTLRLHRLVAARMGLCVRAGINVHHHDGNPMNNTRGNLNALGHIAHANYHAIGRMTDENSGQ